MAEVPLWPVALTALWGVSVSTVDALELAVGAGAAFLGALATRAARRAVGPPVNGSISLLAARSPWAPVAPGA
ncbi:hypothetical protein, partial [Streptomyces sp. NRRL S-146]|uniref:hypothetical protein n=1 Tax=Streptomyces sp. NRRL S-146 TaxID=1463884 RepID=UPI00055DD3B8